MLEVNNLFFFQLYSQTVKSYGTEDRHTDRPVPPKDEIYEYIIFRGSDIKDITVSEPPKPHGLPRDPAIVQVCGSLFKVASTLLMVLIKRHNAHSS